MSDFSEVTIENTANVLGVNSQGGYVTTWAVKHDNEQTDVLYVGTEIKRTGIPILFPRFGKGGELPNHGFGRDCKWLVGSGSADNVSLILTDKNITPESAKLYPYAFEAVISCQLLSIPGFTYQLQVKNTGATSLPISPGIHPYWAISHQAKQLIKTNGIPGFDASQIDWDTNPPDNRYDYQGAVTLQFPEHKLVIEDITVSGPVIKKIVVWSQKPDLPDHNFVCFEPVCGNDMAFYENPIMVEPNNSWNMKLQFIVEDNHG